MSDVLPSAFELALDRVADAKRRQAALRRRRKKQNSWAKRQPSSKSVAESWQRIEAWYAKNADNQTSALAPGAADAQIEQLEKEIGAQLPDDFKESVRVHDGGPLVRVPPRHGELLSLEEILDQWKMYSESQANDGYATGDDWLPPQLDGPIKPIFWSQKRIFVTDNSGDHLTLDLDPPADGKYGQVLHHCHEVGPTGVVASGWAEFLATLVADLDDGKYMYSRWTTNTSNSSKLSRENCWKASRASAQQPLAARQVSHRRQPVQRRAALLLLFLEDEIPAEVAGEGAGDHSDDHQLCVLVKVFGHDEVSGHQRADQDGANHTASVQGDILQDEMHSGQVS